MVSDGMGPYRSRVDADGVHVLVGSSTFRRRLRLNLRAELGRGLFGVGMATALALALVGLTLGMGFPVGSGFSRGTIFLAAWLPLVVFISGLWFFRVVAMSLRPSPLESLLPRELTMRSDGLVVTPHEGPPRAVRWTWLAGARDRRGGIELSLAHDKPVMIFVQGDAPTLDQIRRWLREHRLLHREPAPRVVVRRPLRPDPVQVPSRETQRGRAGSPRSPSSGFDTKHSTNPHVARPVMRTTARELPGLDLPLTAK